MVNYIKTAQCAPLLASEDSLRSYSTFSHVVSSRNSNMAASLNEKQGLDRPFDEEALAAAQQHQQPTVKPRRFKYALLGAAAATVLLYGSGVVGRHTSAQETIPMSAREATHDFTSRAAAAETCTTDACKSYADSVKAARALNYTDIDPCTDFGNYVCGNWYNTHDYRPEQSSVNTLSIMSDVNNAVVRAILESPYPDNSTYTGINATLDKENFEMLQKVYNACMDTDAIKEVGAKPLQDVLANFRESYEPSSLTGTNSTANLTDALIWLQRYGVSVLVGANTAADDRNPNVTLITLGSGSTGLPSKQYYNNTKALANYTVAITGMFDNLFPGNSSHQDLAKKIIELETLIARAEPDPEQSSDVTYYYNPMKVADAEKMIPEISFSRLLAAFVPEGYTNDTVIVNTPDYYPQLSSILKNASSDALYGLLQWNLIQSWSSRIDGNISYPIRRLNNELAGRDANATSQRWQTCLTEVDTNLPWIESAFFIYRAFSTESKVLGDRIVDDIKAIFTEKLQGYEWMTDAVKTKAAQKVANIVKKIGYPDISPNVLNPKSISDFYSCLTVSNSSYFENGLAFNKFNSRALWADLLKPTDKNRWFMTTPTVNAYYNPPSNEIAFPAGIMQTPVFDLDLPEYVSYAAFGAVAGHELTHAFDDSGSHYDENGAFRDWWDNSTLANFGKKTQCFADQYSKYYIITPEGEKLNVNGQLTNGENIADSGGLSAAYAAWLKREADKPNALLPGLEEYTKDQLFYMAFGGLWCGKRRPAEAVRRIYTDPHSPGEFRIFGTVSNQRGFKEAFKCADKEPVCELW